MEPEKPLPPTTTAQQDITTAGQRTINLLWEQTQAKIALAVVLFTIFVNGAVTIILIVIHKEVSAGQVIGLSFLNMICGIVISFYFSRTNHAAIGGIGQKPTQNYEGR